MRGFSCTHGGIVIEPLSESGGCEARPTNQTLRRIGEAWCAVVSA
jgi:hypothetical protein